MNAIVKSLGALVAVSGILFMFVYIFASMGQAFFSGHSDDLRRTTSIHLASRKPGAHADPRGEPTRARTRPRSLPSRRLTGRVISARGAERASERASEPRV